MSLLSKEGEEIRVGDYVVTKARGGTREGYVKKILTSKEETPHPPKVLFDTKGKGDVAHNPQTLSIDHSKGRMPQAAEEPPKPKGKTPRETGTEKVPKLGGHETAKKKKTDTSAGKSKFALAGKKQPPVTGKKAAGKSRLQGKKSSQAAAQRVAPGTRVRKPEGKGLRPKSGPSSAAKAADPQPRAGSSGRKKKGTGKASEGPEVEAVMPAESGVARRVYIEGAKAGLQDKGRVQKSRQPVKEKQPEEQEGSAPTGRKRKHAFGSWGEKSAGEKQSAGALPTLLGGKPVSSQETEHLPTKASTQHSKKKGQGGAPQTMGVQKVEQMMRHGGRGVKEAAATT